MRPLHLPPPIAAYFAADVCSPEALGHCFTAQAVVQDEGHTYRGIAAITAWKADASAKYTYTVEPYTLQDHEGTQVVTSRVNGNFPGSPVDLRYRFRLEGDLIASLEITV